jgi:peptide/nickel transport system permease protein
MQIPDTDRARRGKTPARPGRFASWRRPIATFFGRGMIMKLSFVILVTFVLIAVFANIVAPYDPNAQDLLGALKPPSLAHWLGQDNLGRDALSRLAFGGRVSLSVSILAGILAAVIGIVFGLCAGYYPGLAGAAIMRVTDVLLSIPNLVLSLVLVAIMGGGLLNVVVAIAFGMVPTYIRVMQGLVLSLRENDYVLASRLVGRSDAYILLRHLLPNSFPTIIVLFTINLGNGVLTESTLSYLGVGISPPTASWGSMISDVYPFLFVAPWMIVAPSVCIVLIIIAFNVAGDGLRDALDPRLRGRL